jgi:hypothetical protein
MQEFGLFEPSLILSKDARSPEPCADLALAIRVLIAGQPVVCRGRLRKTDHSVAMLRKHYWEVVDRETAERYWAIRP